MVKQDKYKPLPSYLAIGPSDIEGAGIIAQDDIPKDVVIGITHIYDPNFQHDHIRTPLGGFINHSDSPNCELFDEDDYKKWYEGFKKLPPIDEDLEYTEVKEMDMTKYIPYRDGKPFKV